MKIRISVLAPLILTGIAVVAVAQQAGFKRTVLQQMDISVPGREVVSALAEFQPGATVGRHTHPGEEAAYVIEGSVSLEIDGKPPMVFGPGKTFFIPAGTIHNATNRGSGTTRVLATYIVEKGKPLATPAPAK